MCIECKKGKYIEIVNGVEKRFCKKCLLEYLNSKTKIITDFLNTK